MEKLVTVLGAGAWGTAFANLLAENGYNVILWAHEEEVVKNINEKSINEIFLPGIKLNSKITATSDLQKALTNSKWIFEVIPVKFLRNVLNQSKPYFNQDQTWVILSKGIEQETLFLPSQIIEDVFGPIKNKATISGPNFARDFAIKSYTATTVASNKCEIAQKLQTILSNHYFRPYLSSDLIGVQAGGAIKNLLALSLGILKGAGYSDNTIAFVLTRGLNEMSLIAEYFGGKKETIYGLSGLGDLVLTSFGKSSRNQDIGILIGEGKPLDEILKNISAIPEGINTAVSVKQIIEKNNLNLPICLGTYKMIFEKQPIEDFLKFIMSKPLTTECQ
ncbi:TPA: glycerol-3-phosphate dehydrogenase [Candidatus Dependentiae bacterium]|nr:MAG: Glycerol-3-phosphate dehydrogenase [NAD(P)+] [candidate division TM6 bacterium GW2011_GWE2_31_21]KKP53763.1 MAG: Glycerol-3-phosphate dehydrogenase [NAD(P)+] [candidate division TM6 bacterium GW2011_GWF2_33_332]HBS48483.1 glycerol-3-phosphate dehydrogenase [Candidatus Dependentiae bacterium]HBZ73098.1 glycerol-3-phosphate dehydrogenase [Candidatus Dependentiae bacterium]